METFKKKMVRHGETAQIGFSTIFKIKIILALDWGNMGQVT